MSLTSIADKLAAIMPCDDRTPCCCIPKRSAVVIISIINIAGCIMDLASSDSCFDPHCDLRRLTDTLRKLLMTLFQMANIILLLASVFENALLVDIYVWYTLAYIVMGFMVTICEFVVRTKREGFSSLIIFLPEVVFYFVIFRCLPLVDSYRKHLYNVVTNNT